MVCLCRRNVSRPRRGDVDRRVGRQLVPGPRVGEDDGADGDIVPNRRDRPGCELTRPPAGLEPVERPDPDRKREGDDDRERPRSDVRPRRLPNGDHHESGNTSDGPRNHQPARSLVARCRITVEHREDDSGGSRHRQPNRLEARQNRCRADDCDAERQEERKPSCLREGERLREEGEERRRERHDDDHEDTAEDDGRPEAPPGKGGQRNGQEPGGDHWPAVGHRIRRHDHPASDAPEDAVKVLELELTRRARRRHIRRFSRHGHDDRQEEHERHDHAAQDDHHTRRRLIPGTHEEETGKQESSQDNRDKWRVGEVDRGEGE